MHLNEATELGGEGQALKRGLGAEAQELMGQGNFARP